jgi:hypothetical protein
MPGTSIANGHFVARKLEEAIRVQLARPLRMSMRTRAVYLATGEAPREPGEAQGGRVSEAADGASEQVA